MNKGEGIQETRKRNAYGYFTNTFLNSLFVS